MSDLTDSMVHGTGLVGGLQKGVLSGPPLTEIGHSAFNLTHVRKTKIDCADFSGLAQGDGENEDEADEGPVPNYPRATQRCYSSSSVMGR